MKTINLPALSQVTLEDVSSFLSWLGSNLNGEVSLNQLERTSPIRTSKLNPMLKVIEPFGFMIKKDNRIKITVSGKEFAQSPLSVKKAVIRTLLMKLEQVQRVLELLKTSATGRLHKSVINDSFQMGSASRITESEIQGFIVWGQTCELFEYDKKKEEIVYIDSGRPRDPTKDLGEVGYTAPASMRLVS